MNKYLSNILMLAVLLLAGTAFTSCTHSDDPAPEPQPSGPKTYTLTIKASKSPDTALTRALSLETNTDNSQNLRATWATTETIIVQSGGADVGTLTPQSAGKNVESSGSVTLSSPSEGDELSLFFPSTTISYAGQKGTLADIAANYDYATATAIIKTISVSTITADDGAGNDVTFTSQQAIVQFTFKEFSDGTTLLSPSSLTIDYGTGSVTLTDIPNDTYTTNGSGVLYVAIPGFSDQTLKLTATVGSKTYYYEKSGVTFENGTYRRISLKMFNPFTAPLTLECCNNSTNIAVSNYGTLDYRIDGGSWTNYDGTQFTLNEGHRISFRGTNATSTGSSDLMTIVCNKDCYVYGNVMSLLDPDVADYSIMTTLPYDETFQALFKDQPITHKDGKDLVLPATTLVERCYSEMFSGCTKLDHIVCLATNTSADYCTFNWVYNAGTDESLEGTTKTFVVNSTLTITGESPTYKTVWGEYRGESGIPEGWTVTK